MNIILKNGSGEIEEKKSRFICHIFKIKRQNLDNRLLRLKVDIDEKQPIIQLKNDIAAFAGKLELNAAGKSIKNNTNYKAIIKKNNVYNIPEGLKRYSPIISDDQICIN